LKIEPGIRTEKNSRRERGGSPSKKKQGEGGKNWGFGERGKLERHGARGQTAGGILFTWGESAGSKIMTHNGAGHRFAITMRGKNQINGKTFERIRRRITNAWGMGRGQALRPGQASAWTWGKSTEEGGVEGKSQTHVTKCQKAP